MRLNLTAFCLLLCLGVTLAQAPENAPTKKLRFRRPRPLLKDINKPEGEEAGLPAPPRRLPEAKPSQQSDTAALLSTALNEDSTESNLPSQNPDALKALLSTAAQEPEQLPQEEVEVTSLPSVVRTVPVLSTTVEPNVSTGARRRLPPNVPRRGPASKESPAEKGQRIPFRPKEEPVKTTDNYSHTNPDGSFTFGYVAEDGSFREETRGTDCITRGKYGYIDPEGHKREFTYTSGLPCNEGTGEGLPAVNGLDNNGVEVQDPISSDERFRSAQPVKLADSDIPDSARPRPQRPRIQGADSVDRPAAPVVHNEQPAVLAPTRGPVLLSTPKPAAGNFDFDSEVDSFTLGKKPALAFPTAVAEAPKSAEQPKPVGPSFSSELVFDPASGTFKTELRQSVAGEPDIKISQSKAPFGQPTQAPKAFSPTPTAKSVANPTPFTAFAAQRPAAQTSGSSPVSFTPLNFPSPSPAPTVAPTRAPSAAPSPIPSVSQASPSLLPTPTTQRPTSPPTVTAFAQPTALPQQQIILAQQQQQQQQQLLIAQQQQQQQILLAQAQQKAPPSPTAAPSAPAVQFAFQPLQQQQQIQSAAPVGQQAFASRPFTAFSNGLPPQLAGQTQQQFFSAQPQQQQFQPQQVPFQFQQQPQGARFTPQVQPQATGINPFSVFNPSNFFKQLRF